MAMVTKFTMNLSTPQNLQKANNFFCKCSINPHTDKCKEFAPYYHYNLLLKIIEFYRPTYLPTIPLMM
jgi:hypothetical protein